MIGGNWRSPNAGPPFEVPPNKFGPEFWFKVLLVLLILVISVVAWVSSEELETWFDTSTKCIDEPANDRVLGTHEFQWKGQKLTVVVRGNELGIYKLKGKKFTLLSKSHFRVPVMGDVDYNIQAASVCDECVFGSASFRGGLVLFKFQDDETPYFETFGLYSEKHRIPGVFTFKNRTTQYLVAEDLYFDCGGHSAVYLFDDTEGPLTFLGCVQNGDERFDITNGAMFAGYVFLSDRVNMLHLFRVVEAPQGPVLSFERSIGRAFSKFDNGFYVAKTEAILAVADGTEKISIYDISSLPDLVLMGTIPGKFNRVEISFPKLFACKLGSVGSEITYDISDPENPVDIAGNFWEPNNPWNGQDSDCVSAQAGAFIEDGDQLITARYSLGQRFDVSEWKPPQPDPDEIFLDGFESGNTSAWSEVKP